MWKYRFKYKNYVNVVEMWQLKFPNVLDNKKLQPLSFPKHISHILVSICG